MKPLMGKVCELMNEANYPKDELTSYVSRARSGLKNLVTSHSSLADRIFRQVSLQGTPFEKPVEGTYESLGKLETQALKSRLQKLNDSKKVLYVSGPSDIKEMKNYLKSCNWKNEISLPDVKLKKPSSQLAIYLVPVPSANQAQIRIGRYITQSEVQGKYDNFQLLAGFLGGSFTSKLVQELRVKRGLTYSAGAYASLQRDYGRAGIMTFTKNETATETIKIIREIFSDISAQKFSIEEFKHQQGHQIGAYAFGFEEMSAFIGQLIQYDHQNRNLSELAEYPERVGKLNPNDLAWANKVSFPWERLTVVVIGDRSLEKSLSVIRPVRILNYKDFL
jgi:zinc protease